MANNRSTISPQIYPRCVKSQNKKGKKKIPKHIESHWNEKKYIMINNNNKKSTMCAYGKERLTIQGVKKVYKISNEKEGGRGGEEIHTLIYIFYMILLFP